MSADFFEFVLLTYTLLSIRRRDTSIHRRETFQSLTTRRCLDRARYSLVVHARKLCTTVNKLIEIENRSLDTNVRIELGSKCETIL